MAHSAATEQSIQALYKEHHSWLHRWLCKMLGDGFEAADVAHDVFVRLLNRPAMQQYREPRAYLSTVAKNLVVEHWRRRELERAWLDTLAAMPEATAPSPESRLLVLEALIQIDRMLDSLKPKIRTAFLLAQLDGLTCPQIAEHMGVSRATVERYIASALLQCCALTTTN
ncbi:sigma-70 family RNA polymerase sigma factor [Herbaspirillum sp. alder98]|uniref:sigma-70 family RNA polymerase sigma factor n=1 Tax=Herbaspirillum sp. alder98 TaxID=2913096 RepID=UPI001CD8B6C7|nr:sigma-70 family RNA polymerase sigma factor [Herbaspirillum sp. alder98]MCA1323577.1 sigma-70 family RNA polymerase sigma factor [Herbaspirillum sp. alder98]